MTQAQSKDLMFVCKCRHILYIGVREMTTDCLCNQSHSLVERSVVYICVWQLIDNVKIHCPFDYPTFNQQTCANNPFGHNSDDFCSQKLQRGTIDIDIERDL